MARLRSDLDALVSNSRTSDDWRLRIGLEAEGQAHELLEHLDAAKLEHDLSTAFRDRVVVSRDGGEVFCYAGTAATRRFPTAMRSGHASTRR